MDPADFVCDEERAGLESHAVVEAESPCTRAVEPRLINNGRRDLPRVALTFDACSSRATNGFDARVTQILLDTETPATIFLGGRWIEEEPEHAHFLASVPYFELGTHGYWHPHLPRLSDDRIRDDLRRAQEAFQGLTGRPAVLFRPPYGEYDSRVVRFAAEQGLATVEYDLPSGDPDQRATKDKLVEWVTANVRNGSIVVMHINQKGMHTADALPNIIARLRKRGFSLVTVSELVEAR